MRGVRFTANERALLDIALGPTLQVLANLTPMQVRALNSIRTKLATAIEPGFSVNIQPLERALITAAGHKIVPLQNGYERASRQAGSLLITSDDMTLVGTWMLNQAWLIGKLTILDVLNKWPSWYAKAIAERDASKGPRKGIGNGNQTSENTKDTGPGVNRESQNTAPRRPAQGLR